MFYWVHILYDEECFQIKHKEYLDIKVQTNILEIWELLNLISKQLYNEELYA